MAGEDAAGAEPGPAGGAAAAPSPPGEDGETRQRYEELCRSLNMDERARAEAWLSYQSMRRNYTLEVREGGRRRGRPGGSAPGGGGQVRREGAAVGARRPLPRTARAAGNSHRNWKS